MLVEMLETWLCTWLDQLLACDCMLVEMLETWLCTWLDTLLACDWMLSMALFTSPLLLLSSLPHPVTAIPAIASAPVTAPTATICVNLLDCSSMEPLLLPGPVAASRLLGPYR